MKLLTRLHLQIDKSPCTRDLLIRLSLGRCCCTCLSTKSPRFFKFLKDTRLFGTVIGLLYTIEFQKRGLPHCHTLLWVDDKDKIQRAEDIDQYISAELLDPEDDPHRHRVVSEMMVHGPCGLTDPSAPYKIVAQITRPVEESPLPSDRAQIQVDEIKNFVDGRYICPYEAFWRILKFEFHCRHPAVQILCVHLENIQVITFRDRQPLEVIFDNEAKKKTTLTEWLEYNKIYTDGRGLTYLDFLKHFVWYPNLKTWCPRQRQAQGSIGRLAHVHLNVGKIFYLWMLLCHQKGCQSFEDIRTVNNRLYSTFRSACEALGLLGEDKEWDTALMKACFSSTSSQLRNLFAQLLIFCEVTDPQKLWSNHSVGSKAEQRAKNTYDRVIDAAATKRQELIFVYGHEETGKTFLWKTIINTLRSQAKIVLAVASSGIASLLLPSGRTTHSRFKLPLELIDESICKIKKNTHAGTLLAQTDVIIWDESPMNDRRCFKTLDRTLRDILDAPKKVFGGKTVIFGGDFWQTLPVKKGALKPEIISSLIAESYLWSSFTICSLKENMWLLQPRISESEKELARAFATWLLDIGNGYIGEPDIEDSQNILEHPSAQELQQKAIVCTRNDTADMINSQILKMVAIESTIYKSSDEAIPLANDKGAVKLLYPMEYLNTL
ncbi:DNA helicase [Tanacetum coccineum]